MSLRGMNTGVRRAALASAGAHLVYGGLDVLFAGAAFCVVWRLGIANITEEDMNEPIEDGATAERLLRIASRARAQSEAPESVPPVHDGTSADGRAAPPPPLEDDASPLATAGRIDNLCREIDMPSFSLDPVACADAMLGSTMSTSRTLSAFRRARAEASYGELWAAEVHAGETMVQTMSRVIAQGMPRTGPAGPAVGIVCGPGLEQMRAEFDALPSAERADEIERHLWAMREPDRVRTRFSALLSAIGIS